MNLRKELGNILRQYWNNEIEMDKAFREIELLYLKAPEEGESNGVNL